MTLPPDPGSLKTTSLQDQSDQISRAQLLEQEAAKLAGNITAAPGTDEYVFAQKAADDARFYAGRQREDAQNLQARYHDEKEVVNKYNEQVIHADKDHNGRSDFVQHQEAEAAAPFKALGAVGAGLVGLELTNEAMKHPSAIFGHKMALAEASAKTGADEGPASPFNKLATSDQSNEGQDIGFPMPPAGMMNSIAPAPENRRPAQAISISPQSPAQREMTAAPVEPDVADVTQVARPVMRPRNHSLDLENSFPAPRPKNMGQDGRG